VQRRGVTVTGAVLVAVAILGLASAVGTPSSGAAPGDPVTQLVSTGPGVHAPVGSTIAPFDISMSADGRFVAFDAFGIGLVPEDTNPGLDVFVADRTSGKISLVSTTPAGGAANGLSIAPSISADGSKVAFQSSASNLVATDTNLNVDVFVRDLHAGTTTIASVSTAGVQATGQSFSPALASDGSAVSFSSDAPDLVAGDTAGHLDVFVRTLGPAPTTTRVSVGPAGVEANGDSTASSISSGGDRVVFSSAATNLVLSDAAGHTDVFLRTLSASETRMLSLGSGGEADGDSTVPEISADGSHVTFASSASNLVAGDSNGAKDIFLATTANPPALARVNLNGTTQADTGTTSDLPHLDSAGTRVTFQSDSAQLVSGDTNGHTDTFLRDTATGVTTRTSRSSTGQASGSSTVPAISGNGLVAAFTSDATNIASDDTSAAFDIFVNELATNTVTAVNRAYPEANEPSFGVSASSDGRYVAFASYASNLVAGDTNATIDVFRKDLTTGTIERVSVAADGSQNTRSALEPSISADGRFVSFTGDRLVAGDTNQANGSSASDVYVRDMVAHTTTMVSVSSDEVEGQASSLGSSISADGQTIAFRSHANNLVAGDTNDTDTQPDIFVRHITAGTTERASVATAGTQSNGFSDQPYLSGDGTHVAFSSNATNLVANDTNTNDDVFVRDLVHQQTERVSLNADGSQIANDSYVGGMSADGSMVGFATDADGVVAGDNNAAYDGFVRNLVLHTTALVTVGDDESLGNGDSDAPLLSANGSRVLFGSTASNLVAGDSNGARDLFVRDLAASTTTRGNLATAGTQDNESGSAASEALVGAITSDGTGVAFTSLGSNLVAGDTNALQDAFFRRLAAPAQASTTTTTTATPGGSSTTTTAAPGGSSTTTTAAPGGSTTTSVLGAAIPRTGSNTRALLLMALLLVGLGCVASGQGMLAGTSARRRR
jgi:hypothetical protein